MRTVANEAHRNCGTEIKFVSRDRRTISLVCCDQYHEYFGDDDGNASREEHLEDRRQEVAHYTKLAVAYS